MPPGILLVVDLDTFPMEDQNEEGRVPNFAPQNPNGLPNPPMGGLPQNAPLNPAHSLGGDNMEGGSIHGDIGAPKFRTLRDYMNPPRQAPSSCIVFPPHYTTLNIHLVQAITILRSGKAIDKIILFSNPRGRRNASKVAEGSIERERKPSEKGNDKRKEESGSVPKGEEVLSEEREVLAHAPFLHREGLDCLDGEEGGDIECEDSKLEICPTMAVDQYTPTFELLTPNPIKPQPSELKTPTLDKKPLPSTLKYVFLGEGESYPIVISSSLTEVQERNLLEVLKKHRAKPVLQMQRQLNPTMKEVVRGEVQKLIDASIIYPIADSKWVSPTQVIPKKSGITVVKNENNELIPIRIQTGWQMCIDYRCLNAVTTKDHFPLPFLDQVLERVA
ncbi:hypothetical protein Acr_29g0011440 [Actinidia rufa]|uniref:Reverse transcriptase domain-containing protein n=1 Tax=Actinidia rufa TaxID=165716 RepID=A0A7J0HG46_9ERIC|nr:hypothetical protein Acr_29g0011440 [Actinidia rufa]